jgi:arylsulfatase
VGLRYNDWKIVFMEQREHGWNVWAEPMISLRFPKVMNLRRDPFERAHHESSFYDGWWVNRMYVLVPAQKFVREWLQSFKEFPIRQRPSAFNLDQVMEQMQKGSR